ncbi:uncharacterized protein LOC121052309 [Rosa chinensis]|uniref:uncharacterized protein LOC121052309 n=1 Tax=Rosa chinensis TaxID=74649 RepID=UPI001AD8C0D3|nr:uncharacterized protein LOC121052309 [Rosa chinensis]
MDYNLPEGGIEAFHSLYERLSSYLVEKEAYDRVATLEVIHEEISDQEQDAEVNIQLAPAALDDTPPKVRDPTEKVNLGTTDEPMEVVISPYLEPSKIQPFSPLLRLQGQAEFVWEPKHQEAFDRIKAYLASPPVLVPPRTGFPLKLYISAAEASIGSLLAQDDEEGVEHAIFCLSRTLTDCETRGRIGKWVLALSEFSLQYVPQKAVKGQAIADFLAHHPTLDIPTVRELEIATITTTRPDLARIPEYAIWYQAIVSLQPWVLFFEGSRTETLAGAGIVLENPAGDRFSYSFQLEFKCTNNQAEYEALIIGLEVLLELGVRDVQVRGDSLVVINQLQEKYRCASYLLVPYLNRAIELLDQFDDVGLEYIPRERNFAANELAQLATGITLKYGVRERILKVERRTLPSWLVRSDPPDDPVVAVLEPIDVDWRIPLINYLTQPDLTADKRTRFLALNYFLKDDELRRRGEDGIDFRCVYGHEAKRLMRQAHTGVLQRPSSGTQDAMAHQKTWWVKAEPLKEASGATIRQFIFRNIICRFGIPEVLISDWGAAFMGGPVEQLVNDFGIQFIHSTPYYAQSNGQAEASNKIIITLLKKMLVENPRQWHDTLYETLWAYRTSKRNPIATTPYALMFGHDIVLPLEINVHSLRVQDQHHLISEDYVQAMWQEHEDLSEQCLTALDNLVMEKQRIARTYDKRTRGRSYKEEDLVWKAVLPFGEKLTGCGKWTLRWEGPFVVHRILERGAFHLKDLDGELHRNPINGRFLKKYYPSVWEFEDPPAQPSSQTGGQS